MFKKQRSSMLGALRRIDTFRVVFRLGRGGQCCFPVRKAEGAVLNTHRSAYMLQVQTAESLLTRGI